MPCEGCRASFTLLRRKKSCYDCKRYYCSSCLSPSRSSLVVLCERCAIFAKRPLLRADLLQLKPKDLIFYLQSKHISTTGCVEKDELIGLVLNHVQQADAATSQGSQESSSTGFRCESNPSANPLDSLKQTCQNFFSNITDNISDSFASLDGKTSGKSTHTGRSQHSQTNTAGSEPMHIFDQPRVSTREIPTYASYRSSHNVQLPASLASDATSRQFAMPNIHANVDRSVSPCYAQTNSSSSTTTSAAGSPSSVASNPRPGMNSVTMQSVADCNDTHEGGKSDCECFEDELIASFNGRLSGKHQNQTAEQANRVDFESASTSECKKQAVPLADICEAGDTQSSQSSFEEVGAIGGISDDSKAATDTNSSNMDQWQILDMQRTGAVGIGDNIAGSVDRGVTAGERSASEPPPPVTDRRLMLPLQTNAPQRTKKVVRRRSDGYLNRRRPHSDDDSPPTSSAQVLHEHTEELAEEVEAENLLRRHTNCKKCGKNKSNIKRHVEKMRRHLENSQMSEADIKRELEEFLAYLETRTKSIDHSDSDTPISSLNSAQHSQTQAQSVSTAYEYEYDDNEGIYVYAAAPSETAGHVASRFISLESFNSLKELENLTVKQLKEILMLHRVDYKGCCEKQELLDRVERLWKHLKSTPAADKLHTDELCKICMDAPIECVILECGHMATCTNCGKVLSECPICRQYIVRVVRFFRA